MKSLVRSPLFFVLSFSTQAHAIDVDLLRPTLNPDYPMIEGVGRSQAEPLDFQGGVALRTVTTPLVHFSSTGVRSEIVRRLDALTLGVSTDLTSDFRLGADISGYMSSLASASARAGLGDARIVGRWTLSSLASGLGFALMPELYLPTGNESLFVGQDSFGAGLRIAAEHDFGVFGMAFNLGASHFYRGQYSTIDQRYQVSAGTGAHIPFTPHWSMDLSASAVFLPTSATNKTAVSDWYVGGHYRASSGLDITLGSSLSGIQQDNSLSFRVIGAIKFALTRPTEPAAPVVQTPVAPVRTPAACGPHPASLQLVARALTEDERSSLPELPYRSTEQRAIDLLSPGEANADGRVRDAQVVFAVDLDTLPERDAVLSSRSILLEIGIVAGSGRGDTGLICILGAGTCSGDLRNSSDWRANINGAFFHDKETPNDYFTRELARKKTRTLRLDLAKVLENSLHGDPLALLYSRRSEARTIYFAVASDLYVAPSPLLTIDFVTNDCAQGER